MIQIVSQPFVAQWPKELTRIRAAVAQGDIATVLHIAHALKGTLAMFGAQPARDLAQQLERCAERGDGPGVELFITPFVCEVDHLLLAISHRSQL